MVDRVRLDGYNGVKQNLLKMKLFKLKLLIKNMENMKKLLFLLMVAFTCFQVNAQDDYSSVNYIEKWGRLKIVNKQLCSESGQAVQLKGWSTFGLQWQVSCYSKRAVEAMKAFGANSVRVAMYVKEGGFENDRGGMINKVKDFISWTKELGLYCVVDWHILNTCGNPEQTLNQSMGGQGAEYFFTEIANYVKQNDCKHVLYELCNEPNQCNWNNIKNYANIVTDVIQNIDRGAIMILGTPQWCQLINEAVSSPMSKHQDYILYSFHFYSCSHMNFLSKLQSAAASIPVVVSEWGAVNFDGDQQQTTINGQNDFIICTNESDNLLAVCDGDNNGGVKISWWYWNWGDKFEGSSSWRSCGNYKEEDMLASGRYIKDKLCGDSDDCGTLPPLTGGPFNGEAQVIPTPSGGYFEVAYYDEGGAGNAYYDGDGDEDATENYERDENCNIGYKYAGEDYNFRNGECVDVSGCYGLSGSYTNYNLCNRENDEWLKYTVEVKEAGYYSFEYMSNPATGGTVSFSLEKPGENGAQPLGNCMFTVGTEDEIAYVTFDSYDDVENCSVTWECWEWDKPLGAKSPSLLFREAGTFTIKMTFPEEGGDLGPFRFTKAASYSGEGYPEASEEPDPGVGLSDAASAAFSIYPNPTTGEININFAAAEEADVEIINMIGQVVYSSKIESGAKINADLVKGTYIVTVKTANSVAQQKLVVE